MKDQGPGDLNLGGAPTPSVDEHQVLAVIGQDYGIVGDLKRLSGERDLNFLLTESTGSQKRVRIANGRETTLETDLQCSALLHMESAAPQFEIPRLISTTRGAPWTSVVDEKGIEHNVSITSYLDGVPASSISETRLTETKIAKTLASVDIALRGFFHPGGAREILWNLTRIQSLTPLAEHLGEPRLRAICLTILNKFVQSILPKATTLRSQFIHNDLNLDNILVAVDDPLIVVGAIDFGDICFAPLVFDVAVAASHVLVAPDEYTSVLANIVAAYDECIPLDRDEIDIISNVLLARWAMTVLISNRRAQLHEENADYILRNAEVARRGLLNASALARPRFTGKSRGVSPGVCRSVQSDGTLLDPVVGIDKSFLRSRRQRAMGPAYRTFYESPLCIVRGNDVWVEDDSGKKYLDAYNNVPHVGHCHPSVTESVATQMRLLNTHTRYLHPAIVELAETLGELAPESLDVVMFSCTGSEANELAIRIARSCTKARGLLVTKNAYHGGTSTIAQLSRAYPSSENSAPWVELLTAPRSFSAPGEPAPLTTEQHLRELEAAIERLSRRGEGLCALMVDSVFASDGILTPPDDYLRRMVDVVHQYGGLFIADEVQAGYGRTGTSFWGFEGHGVSPDIITLGKPMGNGYPIAATITSEETLSKFGSANRYFNTFGGSPVAASAGLAVLDVMAKQNLREQAFSVGKEVRGALRCIQPSHAAIADVRGRGLFVGVEIAAIEGSTHTASELADRIVNRMKSNGVLVSAVGPNGNVVKIRPPMTFEPEHARVLIESLDVALEVESGCIH